MRIANEKQAPNRLRIDSLVVAARNNQAGKMKCREASGAATFLRLDSSTPPNIVESQPHQIDSFRMSDALADDFEALFERLRLEAANKIATPSAGKQLVLKDGLFDEA